MVGELQKLLLPTTSNSEEEDEEAASTTERKPLLLLASDFYICRVLWGPRYKLIATGFDILSPVGLLLKKRRQLSKVLWSLNKIYSY